MAGSAVIRRLGIVSLGPVDLALFFWFVFGVIYKNHIYRNDVARLCRIMVASTRGLICRKGRGLISFKFKKREVVDIFGTAVAIVT